MHHGHENFQGEFPLVVCQNSVGGLHPTSVSQHVINIRMKTNMWRAWSSGSTFATSHSKWELLFLLLRHDDKPIGIPQSVWRWSRWSCRVARSDGQLLRTSLRFREPHRWASCGPHPTEEKSIITPRWCRVLLHTPRRLGNKCLLKEVVVDHLDDDDRFFLVKRLVAFFHMVTALSFTNIYLGFSTGNKVHKYYLEYGLWVELGCVLKQTRRMAKSKVVLNYKLEHTNKELGKWLTWGIKALEGFRRG
jgi:hypothetical protein